MRANRDDLTGLLQLQQIDLDIMRKTKELDGLPQRGVIVAARKKREAIEAKRGQVDALKKDAAKRATRIGDEDASLAKKEAGTQAAIDAARGDYRHVEARTKELASIVKRRETLAENLAGVNAELKRISDMETQVALALEELDNVESKAVASFQQQGGALKADIAKLKADRQGIIDTMTPEVAELYDKTAARTGGVAVGMLKGNTCGTCRATIESGRLIDLRAQAPLGVCPACKRLLIIEQD